MRWFLLIAAVLGFAATAKAGSQSGGGGTVVIGPDGPAPVLLDLYLHADDPMRAALSKESEQRPLARTPFLEASGIELMDLAETRALAVAEARLEAWRPHAPHLVLAVLGVLRHKIQLFYTYRPIVRYKGFYLPRAISLAERQLTARTAIIYDRAFGPIIDATIWNELHELSQAGLLIHESLRYFQGIHPDALTDRNIQELTARLMLDEPGAGERLESARFLGAPLAEVFALPFWRRPDEAVDGVRFRLYFRWIRAQREAIEREVDQSPEPLASELRKRLTVIDRGCMGAIAEHMEIRCAMVYAMVLGPWLDMTERGSAAHRRLEALRLADEAGIALPSGETRALWTFAGRPSPFYHVFYERLLLATGDPNADHVAIDAKARELPHPLAVRRAVNADGPEDRPVGADDVISLIQRYLGAHIHKP